MAKRPNLAELASVAGSVHSIPAAPAPAARAVSGDSASAPMPAPVQGRPQPATRAGLVPVTAYFPPEVRTQLKLLAAERGRTMESMIGEAFNDLFAKYGKGEIAPTDARRSAKR